MQQSFGSQKGCNLLVINAGSNIKPEIYIFPPPLQYPYFIFLKESGSLYFPQDGAIFEVCVCTFIIDLQIAMQNPTGYSHRSVYCTHKLSSKLPPPKITFIIKAGTLSKKFKGKQRQ